MDMRARYYSPADGRFTTEDTWQGDQNQPMSYNGWLYVYANPVNYTNPTGHMLSYSCQNMPTKALYELCILGQYGVEPISYSDLGQSVQGKPGCYSGPTAYRAPGYLEGAQWNAGGGFPTYLSGSEVVYNFARMERSDFTYSGLMFPAGVSFLGANIYYGTVHGFMSNKSINEQYKNISFSDSEGIGVIGSIGRGGFQSGSDLMLGGTTWYLGLSASVGIIEGLDLNGASVLYYPIPGKYLSYILPNKTINKSQLFSDIFSGTETPWPVPLNYINISRFYGIYLANKYITAYEALPHENN